MNKKLVAVLLAGVLAVGGVLAVVSYARGADERAYGDAELASVLVVTADVPAGSPASRLAGSVKTIKVPRAVVADGAVRDLSSLGGEVTNAALVPGEQVLKARFGPVEAKTDTSALPAGMQTMDVVLAAPRVPVGTEAGDTVGVVASFGDPSGTGGDTRMVLSRVRIMALKEGAVGVAGGDAAAEGVRVTLAVTTRQAEAVANAAEFGRIWLTSQNAEADTKGSKRTSSDEVLG